MMNWLDLHYYATVVKRRLAYFLVPFLAISLLGIGIVLSLPKMYNSSAKILVESQQIPDSFVKATVTALAAERIEVLKQRVLTRENLLTLIDKFQLFKNRQNSSRTEIVDLMRERISINNLDIGLGAAKKGAARGADRLSLAFAVGFNSESPTVAAKVANELVTIVLEEDVRNRTSAANETTKFLSREAVRLSDELGKMDAILADFKKKNADSLPERLQFSMAMLERQNREIEDINRSISNSGDQKRLIELEARIKQSAFGQGPAAVASGTAMEQQLAKLQMEYAQKSAIFADSHPEIRALETEIKTVKKQIAFANANLQKVKPIDTKDPNLSAEMQLVAEKLASIDQAVVEAKKRSEVLTKSVEVLKQNIEGSSTVTANLESLMRKRGALQENVDSIENKLGQAKLGEQLEQDQQAERFSVIEAPVVPSEPISPKRVQLMLMAVAAAFGIGGGSAFGAEMMDSTIRRSRDITKKLGHMNILVNVPYIKTSTEFRKKRGKIFLFLAIAAIALLAGLAAVHFFITPLDLLVYTLRSNLNI